MKLGSGPNLAPDSGPLLRIQILTGTLMTAPTSGSPVEGECLTIRVSKKFRSCLRRAFRCSTWLSPAL